ncbi:hypothetical protein M0802_010880 [Mischocyttarus mexicanus]|nr:hypothetical protein M0802_010880 [Mischocyttarus mexicanus]
MNNSQLEDLVKSIEEGLRGGERKEKVEEEEVEVSLTQGLQNPIVVRFLAVLATESTKRFLPWSTVATAPASPQSGRLIRDDVLVAKIESSKKKMKKKKKKKKEEYEKERMREREIVTS